MTEVTKEDKILASERDGFIKMAAVALGANIAAATVHTGRRLDWAVLTPEAMAGAVQFWDEIQKERKRNAPSNLSD